MLSNMVQTLRWEQFFRQLATRILLWSPVPFMGASREFIFTAAPSAVKITSLSENKLKCKSVLFNT